ncbi:hypothetical protein G7Y89_g3214 [Cudoniella acicularis]|uniref:Heterokaryon incompatibility domain-containing protein n=1 Tax=Cudoniella acicularis TaxID=354080 RepID=A0A8H4RTR2_9HELO|nr:hypothetical protein G7Y89_g3214 [Cudoniella acicularis]
MCVTAHVIGHVIGSLGSGVDPEDPRDSGDPTGIVEPYLLDTHEIPYAIMRLLELKNDGELSLTKDLIDNIPPYAILSHTWGEDNEEATFQDLVQGVGKSKTGYRKIRFCKEQATRDSLQYVWVDTCCIDKSNNTELSEAINSMFRWYREAAKCYVYLSDISTHNSDKNDLFSGFTWESAFQKSRWFTRGWTLQELIAPVSVEFFSREGKHLGDKKSLEQQVHEITRIPISALQGSPLSHFSVSERISWAANRETMRKEDKAYSLMGIFDIHMPLIYGEGREKAFIRLRDEIDKRSRNFQLEKRVKSHQMIPFPRNEDVVIREEIFSELERKLPVSPRHQSAALWGLGGSGKTQIALEFAYRRYDQSSCSIFWVHAANYASFLQDYKTIAKSAELPDNLENEELMSAVRGWIESQSNWLLVLDNADALQHFEKEYASHHNGKSSNLYSLIPQGVAGTILWTSRDERIVSSLIGSNQGINVGSMDTLEAKELLVNLSNYFHLPSLKPQRINKGEGESDKDDESEADDGVLEAATRLKEFSFLRLRNTKNDLRSYEMHKLVQEATRYGLGKKEDERLKFSKKALEIMLKIFPSSDYITWGQCEKFLPHALVISDWPELLEEKMRISELLSKVSGYLFDQGRWREKEPVDLKALKMRREALGERHPDTITSLADLATTYYQQGRLAEAERIGIEVLKLQKEALGERHPSTIILMANLASTYHQQGRLTEAEKIKLKVLQL